MRFAMQVASQSGAALTFLTVCHVPRPTVWTDATYTAHEKTELNKTRKTVGNFVESVYKSRQMFPTNYTCVAVNSPFTDSTIMGYAADHAFDYICISTHGAGMVEKLFGNTTSNLINQSPVPVIAVPATYRVSELTTVLYASDLSQLNEIKRVVDFARPLSTSVELLHFSEPNEPVVDSDIIATAVKKHTDYPVTVQVKPRHMAHALTANIEAFIQAKKPSVLVMFTTQKDGFFKRLFLSGNSVDYSFLTTTPLLVFRKA